MNRRNFLKLLGGAIGQAMLPWRKKETEQKERDNESLGDIEVMGVRGLEVGLYGPGFPRSRWEAIVRSDLPLSSTQIYLLKIDCGFGGLYEGKAAIAAHPGSYGDHRMPAGQYRVIGESPLLHHEWNSMEIDGKWWFVQDGEQVRPLTEKENAWRIKCDEYEAMREMET